MPHELSPRSAPSSRRRSSASSTRTRFLELRPKGPLVIVSPASPTEFKRKQHAQAQKHLRDRMNVLLDRIGQILEAGGVKQGTGGTKVELLEAAVDYIQSLQGQVEELRRLTSGDCRDGNR
ncbi:hypothetical protein BJX61DRAFT_542343 [Aspergillus egyptiacus]|nr:hypothetical protein BJX61DRAFT_542343 [Aspergillus egyptiacus]